MDHADFEDTRTYAVVVNDEEQYSIWPTETPVPAGWREVGVNGRKQDCLAHIETIWTDMRPLSLRRQMAVAAPVSSASPSSVSPSSVSSSSASPSSASSPTRDA